MLMIPERFNKNALNVRAMGTPAETGSWLIEYMCRRIGIPDLGRCDVLDFGCGCRFAEAIVTRRLPVASYTGIDVDREMIDYLAANIADPRLRFVWWDARNPNYNPAGEPLDGYRSLPVGERDFDVICMFSVITHQLPQDAEAIFRLLRRHIRPLGHLFFSANIQDMEDGYREMIPDQPTGHSAYSLAALRELLAGTGWTVVSVEPKRPARAGGWFPIQDSLLCVPAETRA
jgi:SAM-dependent methyltransferase